MIRKIEILLKLFYTSGTSKCFTITFFLDEVVICEPKKFSSIVFDKINKSENWVWRDRSTRYLIDENFDKVQKLR